MKLLLTSSGWEKNLKIRKEFLKLADKKPSDTMVLLVNTASPTDKNWKYVKINIKELERIGICKKNIKIFSLNKNFPLEDSKIFDIIYVCGGNVFHYLDRMRKTNICKEIKRFVKKGVGYFGISAGSIVAGKEISIANICITSPHDRNDIGLKDLNGLRLTDTIIYPHYSKDKEKVIKKFEEKNKSKVLRLTDKQALLVIGKSKQVIE